MSFLRRLVWVGLLSLVGCFGSDYQAHFDPGFTPTVESAARAAAADWMAHVPVTIAFRDGVCPSPRTRGLICMHPVNAIPAVPWEPGTLAGYTIVTEMWLATPLLAKDSLAGVQRLIAHEMGHSMGLQHSAGKTLMNPNGATGSLVVTPADVAQWRTVQKIQNALTGTGVIGPAADAGAP
jgi:hypothetical protein